MFNSHTRLLNDIYVQLWIHVYIYIVCHCSIIGWKNNSLWHVLVSFFSDLASCSVLVGVISVRQNKQLKQRHADALLIPAVLSGHMHCIMLTMALRKLDSMWPALPSATGLEMLLEVKSQWVTPPSYLMSMDNMLSIVCTGLLANI